MRFNTDNEEVVNRRDAMLASLMLRKLFQKLKIRNPKLLKELEIQNQKLEIFPHGQTKIIKGSSSRYGVGELAIRCL